jgi:uncharacterized protein (TIGR03118 family)
MLHHSRLNAALLLALSTVLAPLAIRAQNYNQINLVANTASAGATIVDPNLVNPWGLSRSATSPWWIADAGSGLSTVYEGNGTIAPLVVTVPENPLSKSKTGSPAGIIFNGNPKDFLLGTGDAAAFIFSTLDGTIAAWPSPTGKAVTVFKATDGSAFTGLTSANLNGKIYLYAANFSKGRVDLFNSKFAPVDLPSVSNDSTSKPEKVPAFTDSSLPAHYVPFNVQAIGDDIVVTYALDNFSAGPGLGFVDIFSTAGQLLQRLEHSDWLNAPWGVALAPNDFGAYSHALLIGQFGAGGTTEAAGTISAYDPITGKLLGVLENAAGKPLAIEGLWAITFSNPAPKNSTAGAVSSNYDDAGAPAAELYFTAGPHHETDGLFGYLAPVATENTQGNNQ